MQNAHNMNIRNDGRSCIDGGPCHTKVWRSRRPFVVQQLTGDKKVAKKLKLDLSELEVQVFAVPDSYENVRGTVQGQTADGETCGIGVTCLEEHTCTCTCDPEYTQACPTVDCPTSWSTCACGTQTPGDTICYDTITCCET